MANDSAAADVDVGANLKPKVNGLIGSGDATAATTTTTTTPSSASVAATTTATEAEAEELLQDGLSCSELFKNGEGLTYK